MFEIFNSIFSRNDWFRLNFVGWLTDTKERCQEPFLLPESLATNQGGEEGGEKGGGAGGD